MPKYGLLTFQLFVCERAYCAKLARQKFPITISCQKQRHPIRVLLGLSVFVSGRDANGSMTKCMVRFEDGQIGERTESKVLAKYERKTRQSKMAAYKNNGKCTAKMAC